MSCNGCRVLRKGCSEACVLRSCLHWITNPEAQANATLFLAKFVGRSDLFSVISAVTESQRPVLFQSLLFEACGRTVNPVNGAVGLLWSGNWHVCQTAVETVLAGGTLQPITEIMPSFFTPNYDESSTSFSAEACRIMTMCSQSKQLMNQNQVSDHCIDVSIAPKFCTGRASTLDRMVLEETESKSLESNGGDRKKLLNLFV